MWANNADLPPHSFCPLQELVPHGEKFGTQIPPSLDRLFASGAQDVELWTQLNFNKHLPIIYVDTRDPKNIHSITYHRIHKALASPLFSGWLDYLGILSTALITLVDAIMLHRFGLGPLAADCSYHDTGWQYTNEMNVVQAASGNPSSTNEC